MRSSKFFRYGVDLLMTAALLFLMGYQFWGDVAHEWAGTLMVVLFIAHQIMNRRWYTGLAKGSWSLYRVVLLLVDGLVFLSMVGLAVSGVMLSNHVLAFVDLAGILGFARLLHMASAYWGFILMVLHLGCHWHMVLSAGRRVFGKYLEPQNSDGILLTLAGLVVALYGCFAFVSRDLPTYLFLQSHFVFLDFLEPKLLFYFDYVMMMGTFVFAGHALSSLLRKRTARRKSCSLAKNHPCSTKIMKEIP